MNDYREFIKQYLKEYFEYKKLNNMPNNYNSFYKDFFNNTGFKWYFNRLTPELSQEALKFLKEFHNRLVERKNILEIINENFNDILDEAQIYDLRGLSGLMARMGYTDKESQDVFINILRTAYQNRGNQGVIDTFKDMTGTEISGISKGRFTYDSITGQEDQGYRATDYDYDNMSDTERRRMIMQRGHSE